MNVVTTLWKRKLTIKKWYWPRDAWIIVNLYQSYWSYWLILFYPPKIKILRPRRSYVASDLFGFDPSQVSLCIAYPQGLKHLVFLKILSYTVYCIYTIYISDGDKKIYYHTIFIETIWYVWNYSIFVSLSPPNIFLYKSQRWEANLQEIAQKILCKSRGFLQIFPSIYIGIMINLWIHW